MSASLKSFGSVYYGLVAVFMASVLFQLPWLHYAVKPMFMVLLMAYMITALKGKVDLFAKLVLFGLFFSWIGDIALMFDEKIPILFVVGLAAFLIAHLGYAIAFVKNVRESDRPFNTGRSLALAVPFVLFTGAFFYYIKDGLGELYVPVLAYTVVISIMGVTAALRKGHVNSKSYNWILIGAVLFILSDCVIAINKFVIDFENDAILNMALYLTGQFMIAVGAVLHTDKPNT